MTGQDIINKVNVLADDNVDELEVLGFINSAISHINLEIPALFPEIESTERANEYYVMLEREAQPTTDTSGATITNWTPRDKQLNAMNAMFINSLVIQYAHYLIKKQDGSQYEWEDSFAKYTKNLRAFQTLYKKAINKIYLTDGFVFEDGSSAKNGFAVTEFANDSYTGNSATWGEDPGEGSSNTNGRVSSNNPFGW